ncbi:hypothetical protein QEZ54_34110, partial [Catellatospora sp. KI3]|uniref:hypothetical protein n=1 Tax=Catellatospora sp. KI3 TaxID=3041620 RepID=UPI0024824441
PDDRSGAAHLTVSVGAYGRRGWDGPQALAANYVSQMRFAGVQRFAVPELGPGACYWFGQDETVYVVSQLGGWAVTVQYVNLGVSPERRIEAAVLAAREVRAAL